MTAAASTIESETIERRTIAKVSWRLLPLVALAYCIAYIDRTNVGFAALTMNKDLGLSAYIYARRAAGALAGELLNLYAERRTRKGHAFPPDGEWQMTMEAAFPYRETADQVEAIEAVKGDMESERPMDRLVCGDVGFGKTEVALRAAVKAAADGKQVMMLVPTTILAQQHFGTFRERLADLPFRRRGRVTPAQARRDEGDPRRASRRARSTS